MSSLQGPRKAGGRLDRDAQRSSRRPRPACRATLLWDVARREAGQDFLPLGRETEPGGSVAKRRSVHKLPREGKQPMDSCGGWRLREVRLTASGSGGTVRRIHGVRWDQADKSVEAWGRRGQALERTYRRGPSRTGENSTPRREPRTHRRCSTTGSGGNRCWSSSGSQRPPESSASSCSCSGKREGREGGPFRQVGRCPHGRQNPSPRALPDAGGNRLVMAPSCGATKPYTTRIDVQIKPLLFFTRLLLFHVMAALHRVDLPDP